MGKYHTIWMNSRICNPWSSCTVHSPGALVSIWGSSVVDFASSVTDLTASIAVLASLVAVPASLVTWSLNTGQAYIRFLPRSHDPKGWINICLFQRIHPISCASWRIPWNPVWAKRLHPVSGCTVLPHSLSDLLPASHSRCRIQLTSELIRNSWMPRCIELPFLKVEWT